MREIIAVCAGLFVALGALVFALGSVLALLGVGSGTPAAVALMVPAAIGAAAIVLIGGLTWMSTEQDRRLERIEALIRAHTPSSSTSPAPASTPDWTQTKRTVRTVIIGNQAPGPKPDTPLPPLPRVGAEAEAGWYWRGAGPAQVWHPGGPVSWEAHDR